MLPAYYTDKEKSMKKLIAIILIILSLMIFASYVEGIFSLDFIPSACAVNSSAMCRVYGCVDCTFNQNRQKPACRVNNCTDYSFNRQHNNEDISGYEYQRKMCLVYNCPVC